MGNRILITGTDTGVGKTHIGAIILKSALRSGINAFAMKPIETGCTLLNDGTMIPEDAMIYHNIISNPEIDLSCICFYMYQQPLSPNIASRLSRIFPDIEMLKNKISLLSMKYDLLLVEGAGGLLVEIVDGYNFGDLAKDLDMKLLLIAPNRLGVINQIALNLEYIKMNGIKLEAIILNKLSSAPDPARKYNEAELKRRFPSIPIYGDVLKYLINLGYDTRSDAIHA